MQLVILPCQLSCLHQDEKNHISKQIIRLGLYNYINLLGPQEKIADVWPELQTLTNPNSPLTPSLFLIIGDKDTQHLYKKDPRKSREDRILLLVQKVEFIPHWMRWTDDIFVPANMDRKKWKWLNFRFPGAPFTIY